MEGVEFKTEYSGLDEVAPIQPASHFIPQWFKDMPSHMEFPAGERLNPRYQNIFGKKVLYTCFYDFILKS